MAYRKVCYELSKMTSVEKVEGETIEQKMERVVENKEPIEDGAPEIFTERKDGVMSAYNIRTDRWEIACEAMDKVAGSIQARREEKGQQKADMKVVDGDDVKGDVKGGEMGESGT